MNYRTDTKALVMAVLEGSPKHGYGIGKAIRDISRDVLKLGEGQLYPILHELEERALVVGRWELGERDPPRKVYSLTQKGLRELEERKKKWSTYAGAVGSVLNLASLTPQRDGQ